LSVRPNVARLANVKRIASAPNDGMPPGELPARALRDRLGLPRVHHVGGALGDERLDVDAVDQVERVEDVALRLRHLLAFLVADDRVDVDVLERDAAGEPGRHHDHPGDPEEMMSKPVTSVCDGRKVPRYGFAASFAGSPVHPASSGTKARS
jgi:hypothetical protein